MVEGLGEMDSRPRLHGGRLYAGKTEGVERPRGMPLRGWLRGLFGVGFGGAVPS